MKYNPAVLSQPVLETLFVGTERQHILNDIVASAKAAASTDQRNHRLLVGRRGAGKSHITALAYHRIGELEGGVILQRSWLPEDPLTIDNYTALLRQIAERLSTENRSFRGYDHSKMESLLNESASTKGTIIVFIENFDQILSMLDNIGQQQLRHYLQTSSSLLLLATTTNLSRDLSAEAAPLFGFFTTTLLEPFDVRTASKQLVAISRVAQHDAHEKDNAMELFLQSDTGLARLRAIEHLAGGQPRLWATLGKTLAPADLDELINELMVTFDELTPYYQEQLTRLSPLQRRIVGELAHADRPLTVEDLSTELESTSQTISKAINILHREKNWVKPCQTIFAKKLDGRKTWYELAEPLARLVFQVKESRGEPLRLIIEFIRLWFHSEQINSFNNTCSELVSYHIDLAKETDDTASITRMVLGLESEQNASQIELLWSIDCALDSLSKGKVEPIMCLPTTIRLALEQRLVDDGYGASIGKARILIHEMAQNILLIGTVYIAILGKLCTAEEKSQLEIKTELSATEVLHSAEKANHKMSQLWVNTASSIVQLTPEGIATLANWASVSGDLNKASELINDCERVLGADHLVVFRARAIYILFTSLLGDADKADKLDERLHADLTRVIEADHVNTATIMTIGSSKRTYIEKLLVDLQSNLEQSESLTWTI